MTLDWVWLRWQVLSHIESFTLPETNSSHLKMDGWNTNFLFFWDGLFSGSMLVYRSVHVFNLSTILIYFGWLREDSMTVTHYDDDEDHMWLWIRLCWTLVWNHIMHASRFMMDGGWWKVLGVAWWRDTKSVANFLVHFEHHYGTIEARELWLMLWIQGSFPTVGFWE